MKNNRVAKKPIASIAAAMLAAAALTAGAQAEADRLKALEDTVESLRKEVESLKEEREKGRSAADGQKRDSRGPTVAWREGVSINDPQGNWSLRIFGRAQFDYRQFDPEAAADTFGIRRARLGAGMSFLKDYGLTIEGEYATGSASGATPQGASITNAHVDFNWFGRARIRAGQFKPQFGLENTGSANFSDFQERALTHNLIQNLNYDRGIMVHGVLTKGVNYSVTVSNGTGLNLEERQLAPQDVEADGKMLTTRLTADLAQIFDLADSIVHVGASYKTGEAANSQGNPYAAATGQTEARGVVFFNPEPFASSTVAGSNVDRELSAAELALAYRSWKLQGEVWRARYEGERTTAPVTPYERRIDSGYLSVLWLITGERYSEAYNNGVFSRLRPGRSFLMGEGGGAGAWEVGLRYSFFDASDFLDAASGNSNTGRLTTAGTGATASSPAKEVNAWTIGLKWMPNAYSRLMLNYIVTRFDTPIVANGHAMNEERAFNFRAQVDF